MFLSDRPYLFPSDLWKYSSLIVLASDSPVVDFVLFYAYV